MTAPKSYPRAERVRAQIKQVLAQEIERLRDPGIGWITITEVSMTPDLRHARVFYTVLGDASANAATGDALKRATGHLRASVAHHVRLRYTPTIEFEPDPVPERTARLDAIIADLHRAEEDD
jgi:ribosome-binding factor A